MHIGFLTSEYPHPLTGNGGGIGTSIKNLAASLVGEGCKVTVFVITKEYDGNFNDGGVNVIALAHRQYRFLTWYRFRKETERWLNRHIDDDVIQVLEVADWTGFTAFMKLHCPVVMKFHGSDTFFCHLEGRKQKLKNRLFERIAAHGADAYIGVSQFALDVSSLLLKIQAEKPKAVIYNGLNLEIFHPTTVDVDPNLIINTGTLIRKKGALDIPHIFNRVIKANPDAKLLLVGGDSYDIKTGSPSTWALMKPLFSEQALPNVEYLGKVPYNEINDIVNKAGACIYPSYAEALPVSWLECMACGKALVTSNIGWAKEIIEQGENGYMVHPSKHQEYADKICMLLNDATKRSVIGQKAMQSVAKKFSSKKIAKDSIEFYSKVISNKE